MLQNTDAITTNQQQLTQWYLSSEGRALVKEQLSIIESKLSNTRGVAVLECGYCPNQLSRNLHKIRHRIKIVQDRKSLLNDSDNDKYHSCVVSNWDELPFEPNSVDVIILNHVLEFDDIPAKMLREAAILLKPHGDLIITTFNRWSLFNFKQLINSKRKQQCYIPKFNAIGKTRLNNWLEVVDCKIITHQRLLHVGYGERLQKLSQILSKLNVYNHGYSITHARKFTYKPTNLLKADSNPLKKMLHLKPSMTKSYRHDNSSEP